jgi:hypothetical protein
MRGDYEVAVVVSKDTDLIEPIRVIRGYGKAVGVICPDGQIPQGMQAVAAFVRHVTPTDLKASQFPDPIKLPGGRTIYRPSEWALLSSAQVSAPTHI